MPRFAWSAGKEHGTNRVECPVRPYQTISVFLLVSGIFLWAQRVPSPHAPASDQIRLALPADTAMADFLRALGDVTGEPVVWDARCKEIRGKRLEGETVLQGSRQRVLRDAGSLLTFYELKLVSLGPTHGGVHFVTYDFHTCGLGASSSRGSAVPKRAWLLQLEARRRDR